MNIGGNMIKIAVTGLLLGSLAVGGGAGATGMVKLSGLAPQALGAQFAGHHDSRAKLQITVALPLRDQAGLTEFLRELQDPHSINFHRFLTPKQFTAAYGPTKAQVDQVEKFLKQQGFTVTEVSKNRSRIYASASTATVETAFGVAVNDYDYQGGKYFAATTGPTLPEDVASLVTHVFGLDNLPRYQSHLKLRQGTQGVGPSVGFSPLQIATAYGWPAITPAKKLPAAGVTVAIATAFSFRQADVEHFWSSYGLPSHPLTVIPIDGSTRQLEGETTLDVEESSAMSPGSNMLVYEAVNPADGPFDLMFQQIASDNAADVVSTSWGEAESVAQGDIGSVAAEHAAFQQMAAQGMTFMAAAGDDGSADRTTGNDNADFPSSDSLTLAAGGTTLTLDANNAITSEVVWGSDGAAGGADSFLFAEPSYQTDLPGWISNASCVGNTTNVLGAEGCSVATQPSRQNSDLAMDADPATGYAFYYNGRWTAAGGTSFVAPEFAGLYAIVTAQLRTAARSKTRRVGQPHFSLYQDFQDNPTDFNDITSGSNGMFSAGVGWDHPTGLGTPHNVVTLAKHLVVILTSP